jgi:hypothetical protein
MPKYVGSYDDVVRTTAGHTLTFKKGKETWVPENDAVIKLVKQAGHQPAEVKNNSSGRRTPTAS